MQATDTAPVLTYSETELAEIRAAARAARVAEYATDEERRDAGAYWRGVSADLTQHGLRYLDLAASCRATALVVEAPLALPDAALCLASGTTAEAPLAERLSRCPVCGWLGLAVCGVLPAHFDPTT